MLGELYANGQGVNQDFVEAHMWYNLAAARDRANAAQARDALARRMTPEQIARAQQRAADAARSVLAATPSRQAAPAAPPPPSGYSVLNVQRALDRLDFDPGPLDGVMGARTRAAIREYQQASGLPVTGQPSASLYQNLRASITARAPAPPPTAAPPAASSRLIGNVQSELRRTGYDLPVSGSMDAATRSAIIDFQTRTGASVTGHPSESLLASLRSHSGQASAQDRQVVMKIQQELNRRGYDAGPADGTFGPKTRVAIQTYQSDAGLAITGEPNAQLLADLRDGAGGKRDQRALVRGVRQELRERGYDVGRGQHAVERTRGAIREYEAAAGLPATGKISDSLLRSLQDRSASAPGQNRVLVRDVQHELRGRGYDPGPADGVVNPKTRDAIRDYQAATHGRVTGEANVELLASLRRSDTVASAGETPSSDIAREIEAELQRRGYPIDSIDGNIDEQSREAIRQYQRDAGLSQDGQATQPLLAHMRSSNVQARPMTPAEAAGVVAGQLLDQILNQR
jgi:peptidoglycan hydrolase-like protein with peptidoglycan-binding domain